jgi:hypothetical protein
MSNEIYSEWHIVCELEQFVHFFTVMTFICDIKEQLSGSNV